jgi:hypothetical protein
MTRTRATSSEWRQYYDRADEIRARVGDPFMRLIARQNARARVLRIFAIAVFSVAVVAFMTWAFELMQALPLD